MVLTEDSTKTQHALRPTFRKSSWVNAFGKTVEVVGGVEYSIKIQLIVLQSDALLVLFMFAGFLQDWSQLVPFLAYISWEVLRQEEMGAIQAASLVPDHHPVCKRLKPSNDSALPLLVWFA